MKHREPGKGAKDHDADTAAAITKY